MKSVLTLLFVLFLCSFAGAQSMIGLPAQSGTFSGGTRGYWFTAPTCFTITGLRVPTDASTGAQYIQVVKLQAPPPFYSSTTNAFNTLAFFQNVAGTGQISVNIQINSGDIIGVLGYRAGVNSYGTSPYNTSIAGYPVTITRFGFQAELTAGPAHDVWQESGGSVSRVELYYVPGGVASFSSSVSGPTANLTAAGDTVSTYNWDFGDGSTGSGINAAHTYTAPGTYNVCLYYSGTCGQDTVCNPVTICFPPSAGYTATDTSMTVAFTDTSSYPTAWHWDFGDGDTSNVQNPSHTYANMGNYNVCLIVSNGCGADTLCDSVSTCFPPTASFTSAPNGLSASFSDNSTYPLAWSWDFGDGNSSSLQSPSHTYANVGNYNVCLIVTSPCGADTFCDSVFVCEPPVAGFTNSQNWAVSTFSNTSTQNTNNSWTFGDGQNSSIASPTHTYATNGQYVVSLVVDNACGSDTIRDTFLVCVSAPVAAFGYTANLGTHTFADSSQNAVSWEWDFGDGNLSHNQNPTYTYSASGTYTVCLTVTDLCGNSSSACHSLTVELVSLDAGPGGEFSAYAWPNPSRDIPNLRAAGSASLAQASVWVFDATGKLLNRFELDADGDHPLFSQKPATGMYFYRVESRGMQVSAGKFRVE